MTKEQQAAMNDRSRRFQVLMTARQKQYPHESYHDRFMRCSASPEGAAIWAEAEQAKHTTPNAMMAANSYDASQPRDPAGTPTGGQWTAGKAGHEMVAKLKNRKDLFWRVHGSESGPGGSPFNQENAQSSTIDGQNTLPGYSTFASHEELVDYWSGNNFAGRRLSDDDVQVIAFTGRRERKEGADGEPLATPDMAEVYRMPFGVLKDGNKS